MTFVQLVQPGRAGGVRVVRVVDVDADRRADVRHAGAGARALRRGPARAAPRRAVPVGRIAHRVEAPRRAGGVRVGQHAAADHPRRRQLRAPRRRLAGGRPRHRLREVRPRQRPARDDAHVRATASTSRPTARRSTPSARTGPGSTSSGPRTRSPTSRPPSTGRPRPTTPATSSGSRRAGSTPRSGPTRIWKRTLAEYEPPPIDDAVDEELRGVRRPAARPRCPTRSADDAVSERAVHRAGVRGAAGRSPPARPASARWRARVDLPASTVARLLGTLESLGAVDADRRRRDLRHRRRHAELADRGRPVVGVSSPRRGLFLAELVDAGAARPSGISVLDGDEVRVPRPRRDRERGHSSATGPAPACPLHVVSSGLVLLAAPAAERRSPRISPGRWRAFTARDDDQPAAAPAPPRRTSGDAGLRRGRRRVRRRHHVGRRAGRRRVRRRSSPRSTATARATASLPAPRRVDESRRAERSAPARLTRARNARQRSPPEWRSDRRRASVP